MSDIASAAAAIADVVPSGWSPPLIPVGRFSRVVTQADVDRWLAIEKAYRSMMASVAGWKFDIPEPVKE